MSPSFALNASSNGGFYGVSTADNAVYTSHNVAGSLIRRGKREAAIEEEVKTFKGLSVCDELVEACEKLGWKTKPSLTHLKTEDEPRQDLMREQKNNTYGIMGILFIDKRKETDQQIISFTSTLAYSAKYGYTSMRFGNVVDQFHDKVYNN
ncbi:hypothetical protein QJS04_geneDACA000230 [Acorus gramineus]|uniref:Uncharacterized protein n=1 Tax=Acorus gramineus TaxID=55184 RepID=A0AAV9AP76_ACOGR|nr:hypothetical protein QJS04_geneDACA000230 [Acorus gramineus]